MGPQLWKRTVKKEGCRKKVVDESLSSTCTYKLLTTLESQSEDRVHIKFSEFGYIKDLTEN